MYVARRVHDGDSDLSERRQLAGVRTESRLESGRTLLPSRHLQIRIDQLITINLLFITFVVTKRNHLLSLAVIVGSMS